MSQDYGGQRRVLWLIRSLSMAENCSFEDAPSFFSRLVTYFRAIGRVVCMRMASVG